MHMVLRSAIARFDEVLSVLQFDETLRSLAETRTSARNSDWRRMLYSGSIVNMYGGLEQFVDDLIEKYASLCSTLFPNYDQIPESVRKAHDLQARALLTRDGSGRLSRSDTDNMVRCLASCLDGGNQYQLSGTALSYHDRNLKFGVLSEMFARVNVPLAGVLASLRLGDFDDSVLTGVYADLDALLLDLVNRRNEISHGDYTDLASPEVLSAVAEVLKWLVTALFNELRKVTIRALQAQEAGYVTHYYETPKAHLVLLKKDELSVGDIIFGLERDTALLRAATVASLQDDSTFVDHVMRDAMSDSEGIVGMTVEPPVRFGGALHCLPEDAAEILYDNEFRASR